VTFGGSAEDAGQELAAAGGRLYLEGSTSSGDARFDASGPVHPNIGSGDLFVAALDGETGAPVASFAGGVQYVGSERDDGVYADGVAVLGGVVYANGFFDSMQGAGIGGVGDAGRGKGFVVALDATTGLGVTEFGEGGFAVMVPAGDSDSGSVNRVAVSAQGLTVVGHVAGQVSGFGISFPADGTYLAVLDPATGRATNYGRPQFIGPPRISPNPAVAGRPVTLTAFTSDPDGDPTKVTWILDGTPSGAGRVRTFGAPGTVLVQAQADDGRGGIARSAVVALTVLPEGTPHFDVTSATVRLQFGAASAGAIVVKGRIPVADGESVAGTTLTVDVGNVSRRITLGNGGRGNSGTNTLQVGRTAHGTAPFVAVLRGSFADAFDSYGLTAARTRLASTPLTVRVGSAGGSWSEDVPLLWTNRTGRSGFAR
jgi:hypothetical protein